MSLTPEQIAIVKATVPALESHGTEITSVFYKNLLAAHPELNNIFNVANQVHQHQPKALAAAVYAYAKNIENLAALLPTVRLVAGKHTSLGVRPEHYPIIGSTLLAAFQQVLGDAITPEILEAWEAAYQQLANVFITTEKGMYEAAKPWTGFEEFKIAKIDKESDEISSFYLEPVNKSLLPLPKYLPGQYVSVQVQVPQFKHLQARQYSLSDAYSPDYYRISPKRHLGSGEDNIPGIVSNILHSMTVGDSIKVSHPRGDFYMDTSIPADGPIVLLSAGVGLTPMISILNTLKTAGSSSPIVYIHAARNSSVRAFAKHVEATEADMKSLKVFLCNTKPGDTEISGTDYNWKGYIDASKLAEIKDLLSDPKTEVYLCGPNQFMLDMESLLEKEFVVSKNRIKMELFGTGGPTN